MDTLTSTKMLSRLIEQTRKLSMIIFMIVTWFVEMISHLLNLIGHCIGTSSAGLFPGFCPANERRR